MTHESNLETFPIGEVIKAVRLATADECETCGWDPSSRWQTVTVIEFESGSLLFASQDEEGNGPGAFFGECVFTDDADEEGGEGEIAQAVARERRVSVYVFPPCIAEIST